MWYGHWLLQFSKTWDKALKIWLLNKQTINLDNETNKLQNSLGTEGNTANLIWRDQIVVNLLHVPLFHFCEMDISRKLG